MGKQVENRNNRIQKRKPIEVLAPAGSFEILKRAVQAGADAVYAGGSCFGARAYAQNFTEAELLEAIDYAHLYGRKLYLTVNTLVKEREFHKIYEYLLPLYKQGLDAVIVQDMGVMNYIKRQFPGMEIHASTQMTITNALGARYLEQLGVERVVPARELSLREIRKIADTTNLDIECFVHGALCYCYSGQCLLSSMIGGRSGNRGQCAQPCRLPWKTEQMKQPQTLLSLKDLCTIEHIPRLIQAGITSFKIEGRMKQPEYVETVTAMYRKYVDLYESAPDIPDGKWRVEQTDLKRLLAAYQRRGYTDGYYHRRNGREMLSFDRPKACKEQPQAETFQKSQKKIKGNLILSSGKHATLELRTLERDVSEEIFVRVEGAVAEKALKQPVTKERLEKQLQKTGNTPFIFQHMDVEIEGEIFLPVQEINDLRRRGLELLGEKIVEAFRRADAGRVPFVAEIVEEPDKRMPRRFSASVETAAQLRAALESPDVYRIYVEDALYLEKETRQEAAELIRQAKTEGKEVYFAMARIFRQEAEDLYERELPGLMESFDGALVRNLESMICLRRRGFVKPVVSDANLYRWNEAAGAFLKKAGADMGTCPWELNCRELGEISLSDMELIVYGRTPVMVSAGCIRKNTDTCVKKSGQFTVTDRRKKTFPVKCQCLYCYNVIYNTSPLVLLDQAEEIKKIRPASLRLQFTDESAEETKKALNMYKNVFINGEENAWKQDFTRGHFKRGVK